MYDIAYYKYGKLRQSSMISYDIIQYDMISYNQIKRVLEYGVRAPVFYGNLREQTGENGFPRKPTGNLFCSYGRLRMSPETSRSFRENVI